MEYFESLNKELQKVYNIASKAREKGIDPKKEVEIKIAEDVAGRVEGLVGPKGIAKIIKQLEKEGKDSFEIAFNVAEKIANGEVIEGTKEELLEQAVRTALSILTEGVLVAPTEGISKIVIKQNDDGSDYVEIYFAGPIRSAGGTIAGMSALITDYVRQKLGIGRFEAREDEVERYLEEVLLYNSKKRLQYKPEDDEIRHIFRNCPVCIGGDPTEDIEVSTYRNLKRIDTNRVRGGVALVSCEGIAQKAPKLLKYARKFGMNWEWLERLIKVKKTSEKVEIKPLTKYLEGTVAGRPLFAYPSRPGGFRLRYGRTRTSGLMAKAIHPALMPLIDDYLAYGTQLKIERPGKGAAVVTCNYIEPPIVKLKDNSVRKIRTIEEAKKIKDNVKEILYLGDILVSYGDFAKSAHPLIPSPYVEEWWREEAKEKTDEEPKNIDQAIEISKRYSLPLYPKYLLFWDLLDIEQLKKLYEVVKKGEWKDDKYYISDKIEGYEELQKIFEVLGLEFDIDEGYVINYENAKSLLFPLGLLDNKELVIDKDVLSSLTKTCSVEIRAKGPTFIGARMGRPEKAERRAMKGNPNVLFPTGGKLRSLSNIYANPDQREMPVEIEAYKCQKCGKIQPYKTCIYCSGETKKLYTCKVCKKIVLSEYHCNKKTLPYVKRNIHIKDIIDAGMRKIGYKPKNLKGVQGLISEKKVPERIEKGLLREKYDVTVFKDGTARFDMIDLPITHFIPKEIGITIEKLKELGYDKDWNGNEITSDEQIIPIKVQDVIISEKAGEYFVNVAKFIDEELQKIYGLEPYYNITKKEELIGHLVIGLAPHTSAGVVGRIIGFSKANAQYCHPYYHTAKRRNCDGDEDSFMLLLDAFINFSRAYLPEKRGGSMDMPLVLTTNINPKEIDDEVYEMEIVRSYGKEFYEATWRYENAGAVKVKQVKNILETKEQYGNLNMTIMTDYIDKGTLRSSYVTYGSIPEKVLAELELHEKIRAVDKKDAAEKVILNHFVPDLYGNLRKFSKQSVRCVKCNTVYRRPPLKGKCLKCNGNLVLTVSKGGVTKYLEITERMIREKDLAPYLKQRIELLRKEIDEVFGKEKKKQTGIMEFI